MRTVASGCEVSEGHQHQPHRGQGDTPSSSRLWTWCPPAAGLHVSHAHTHSVLCWSKRGSESQKMLPTSISWEGCLGLAPGPPAWWSGIPAQRQPGRTSLKTVLKAGLHLERLPAAAGVTAKHPRQPTPTRAGRAGGWAVREVGGQGLWGLGVNWVTFNFPLYRCKWASLTL